MFAEAPIRWTDPTTWPWIFFVWLTFVAVGFVKPAWSWIQRKRAAGWPTADGRIEAVEVRKSSFSFTTKRGSYVAELKYSYSVAGAFNSGRYERQFSTEYEAAEFVRDLQGRPIVIHYNSARPSASVLLETDIEIVLRNRAPAPTSDSSFSVDSVPDWIRPFLWFFVCFAAVGLLVSLWVHIGAVMGKRVAPEAFFWMLHIGIFVVWIPAVLISQRLVGSVNRKDFWKVALKGLPTWVRYVMYAFFAYAVVNFLLFMNNAPTGHSNEGPPAAVWRGFSGHWMVFYFAALAILYSAANTMRSSPRCTNGHLAAPNAAYCTRCGQPVLRSLNSD